MAEENRIRRLLQNASSSESLSSLSSSVISLDATDDRVILKNGVTGSEPRVRTDVPKIAFTSKPSSKQSSQKRRSSVLSDVLPAWARRVAERMDAEEQTKILGQPQPKTNVEDLMGYSTSSISSLRSSDFDDDSVSEDEQDLPFWARKQVARSKATHNTSLRRKKQHGKALNGSGSAGDTDSSSGSGSSDLPQWARRHVTKTSKPPGAPGKVPSSSSLPGWALRRFGANVRVPKHASRRHDSSSQSTSSGTDSSDSPKETNQNAGGFLRRLRAFGGNVAGIRSKGDGRAPVRSNAELSNVSDGTVSPSKSKHVVSPRAAAVAAVDAAKATAEAAAGLGPAEGRIRCYCYLNDGIGAYRKGPSGATELWMDPDLPIAAQVRLAMGQVGVPDSLIRVYNEDGVRLIRSSAVTNGQTLYVDFDGMHFQTPSLPKKKVLEEGERVRVEYSVGFGMPQMPLKRLLLRRGSVKYEKRSPSDSDSSCPTPSEESSDERYEREMRRMQRRENRELRRLKEAYAQAMKKRVRSFLRKYGILIGCLVVVILVTSLTLFLVHVRCKNPPYEENMEYSFSPMDVAAFDLRTFRGEISISVADDPPAKPTLPPYYVPPTLAPDHDPCDTCYTELLGTEYCDGCEAAEIRVHVRSRAAHQMALDAIDVTAELSANEATGDYILNVMADAGGSVSWGRCPSVDISLQLPSPALYVVGWTAPGDADEDAIQAPRVYAETRRERSGWAVADWFRGTMSDIEGIAVSFLSDFPLSALTTRTHTGDVLIEDVRSGVIEAKTTSGAVSVRNVVSEHVRVYSVDGVVSTERVTLSPFNITNQSVASTPAATSGADATPSGTGAGTADGSGSGGNATETASDEALAPTGTEPAAAPASTGVVEGPPWGVSAAGRRLCVIAQEGTAHVSSISGGDVEVLTERGNVSVSVDCSISRGGYLIDAISGGLKHANIHDTGSESDSGSGSGFFGNELLAVAPAEWYNVGSRYLAIGPPRLSSADGSTKEDRRAGFDGVPPAGYKMLGRFSPWMTSFDSSASTWQCDGVTSPEGCMFVQVETSSSDSVVSLHFFE